MSRKNTDFTFILAFIYLTTFYILYIYSKTTSKLTKLHLVKETTNTFTFLSFFLSQQVIVNRLEYERSLVVSLEEEEEKEDMRGRQSTVTTTTTTTNHILQEGISYLLEELKGTQPWRATWPSLYSNNKKSSGNGETSVTSPVSSGSQQSKCQSDLHTRNLECENNLQNSAKNGGDNTSTTHHGEHSRNTQQDTEERHEEEQKEHTDHSLLLHSEKEHLTSLLVRACELGITLTASFLVVR